MKSLVWLSSFAIALSLVPSLARADEPSVADQAKKKIEEGLVKPLAAHEAETSRFSRARMPPRERRVRVTAPTVTLDKLGRGYVSFAIDVRFAGNEWTENDKTGCVYPKTGEIFVKIGDSYRPASVLVGKTADPVPDVCRPRA